MTSKDQHQKLLLPNSEFEHDLSIHDDSLHCKNMSVNSLSGKDVLYKSPTVLSFDAYGNLTSSDDPDSPYNHEIPSLAEFDYILNSFEGRYNKNKVSETQRSLPSKRNGTYKKNKSKKVKLSSSRSQSLLLSDNDLKQAFKKDFDTSSLGITSRYGRTRKQKKSDDGFLFGTLNFKELRKISTSLSPSKHNRYSISDEKCFTDTIQDDSHKTGLKDFELINSKIADYSSEDEFEKEKKRKSLRSKIPINHSSTKLKKSKAFLKGVSPHSKIRKHKKNSKKSNNNNKKIKCTSAKLIEDCSSDLIEEKTDCEGASSKINSELVISKIMHKSVKEENLSKSSHDLQSIDDDVSIIKSSLVSNSNVIKMPEETLILSNKVKYTPDSKPPVKKRIKHKDKVKFPSNDSALEILKMETLNDEIRCEDQTKSKYGRQIKKTVLLDMSMDKKVKRESPTSLKHSSSVIEEEFLDVASTNDLEIEKEYPCVFFIGDLVWVQVRGNPLWPGMITYPKNETNFTKLNISATTNKLRGPRKYHVQFFYDSHRTMWVFSSSILPYKGIESLSSYFEDLKMSIKKTINEKNLEKSFMKMSSLLSMKLTISKALQWYKAVEEANQALVQERYERIQYFKAPVIEKKKGKWTKTVATKSMSAEGASLSSDSQPVKEKKMGKWTKTVATKSMSAEGASDSEKVKPNPLSQISCETLSNKSKSSDDFSGFEEDSSFERRKVKRLRLESKINQGDFDVYLQKHLHSAMKLSNFTKEQAKNRLQKKWNKLTLVQRLRYKSKFSFDQASSGDTDDSSSDLSSITSYKSRKSASVDAETQEISKGMYKVPRNEKVCAHCEITIVNSAVDIVKCKGVCGCHFHLSCVGLDTVPGTDFKCAECLSGNHKCFVCKSEKGETHKCSVTFCGKFYHENCLKAWPQVSRMNKAKQIEKFVCPRHVCHMCAANADDMNDPAARTPPYTRCLRCPTTYHTGETCIAAGVEEISQNYHICTKHIKQSKNSNHHFNVNWCFCCSKGGSLLLCDQCPAAFHAECLNIIAPEGSFICEDCVNGKFPVYGDIVWVKLGIYRWWPGEVLHPRYIPDNIENLHHVQGMFCVHFFGSDDYYWLSRGRTFHYQEGDEGSKSSASKLIEQKFQKALDEAVVAYNKHKEKRAMQEQTRSLKGNMKPPPYVKIDTNRPVGNVRLGRLDYSTVTKCDCDPYSENPCGSDDNCINRMLMVECLKEVCAGKERCNNQRFQRRQYPNVFPFKTSGRGWGLKTKDFIKKGSFVIEYVGELIDEAEFRRRIHEMHERKEQNYYFLTVETDRMIDAGPKGNLARFMNHSCQPNCETQKWTVGADTRVGLFALEDIPEGSELIFNYNLECVGTEKKICNCGAQNCRGFIGVKVQKGDVAGGGMKKVENGIKKKKKGRKRKSEKDTENECFRCGYEGDLILCDITKCPKGYHLDCLGLKELPRGKWICPWHHCDDCGSRALNRCIMCPNSYCKIHTDDKFNQSPGLENVCLDHCTEDLEALRGQMKAKMIHVQVENTVQKCQPESGSETGLIRCPPVGGPQNGHADRHPDDDSRIAGSREVIFHNIQEKKRETGVVLRSRCPSDSMSGTVSLDPRGGKRTRILRCVDNNKVHDKSSRSRGLEASTLRSDRYCKKAPIFPQRNRKPPTGRATDNASRQECLKENSL